MSTIEKSDKIYVAGHRGLVGSAIVRNLQAKGYENVIGRTHRELDLTSQEQVRDFFEKERPDVVVLAAAKVGGINANNTTPAEFAYENMQIQCNVIKLSLIHIFPSPASALFSRKQSVIKSVRYLCALSSIKEGFSCIKPKRSVKLSVKAAALAG